MQTIFRSARVITFMVAFTGTAIAQAAPVTVPAGLSPGDQYRLAFVGSTIVIPQEVNDIGGYNAIITTDALGQPELAALGTRWTAIVTARADQSAPPSTGIIDARTNTSTDPTPAGATGVPIYLLNGLKLADDYDDLWDGSIDEPFNIDRSGAIVVPLTPGNLSWNGTAFDGTSSGQPLGQLTFVTGGSLPETDARWINTGVPPGMPIPGPIRGISDIFTVAGSDADNDGVPDGEDLCPDTATGDTVDASGCSDAQVDSDGDGVCDPGAVSVGPAACAGSDNCPSDPNPLQVNTDGDADGDACDTDDDNDGDSDADELACGSDPLDAAETCANVDTDKDGVPDVNDACAATVEMAPTSSRGLGRNRWILENRAFTQGPPQSGRLFAFTIEDTRGCSCSQIIVEAGLGKGHLKYGCSNSAMIDWTNNP